MLIFEGSYEKKLQLEINEKIQAWESLKHLLNESLPLLIEPKFVGLQATRHCLWRKTFCVGAQKMLSSSWFQTDTVGGLVRVWIS